ncbi:response regulator [candidate division KSB1 bacterium]|nr:response regulator [candidate division KSB1 bacterium]
MSGPSRYEIVLLEDDPETLELIAKKLQARDITVFAFDNGEKALQKALHGTNIGLLLLDIEIRYPYPDGPRSGLQGYDVANRLISDSAHRLTCVVVMTGLEQEEALDSANIFETSPVYYSKLKWQKLENSGQNDALFDAFADMLKTLIRNTPYRWREEVIQSYPKSRWVSEKKKNQKVLPPYWSTYRNLWLSRKWKQLEHGIGVRALEIVDAYKKGETKKLRGEWLNLTDAPTETDFSEHLVGRRVVYALKYFEPVYWKEKLRGEDVSEESPVLEAVIWDRIKSSAVKQKINLIHTTAAEHELEKLYALYKKNLALLDSGGSDEEELTKLVDKQTALQEKLDEISSLVHDAVTELAAGLDNESESVRKAMIPFLRFWDVDFCHLEWAGKIETSGGGQDPVTQLLLLLGIRQQDIEDENPANWRLLLPEEKKWLEDMIEAGSNG